MSVLNRPWLAASAAALLLPVCIAQTPHRRHASQPAAAAHSGPATLVISCDLACDWQLDDEDTKSLLAGASTRVRVDAGDHTVVGITSSDGKDKIERDVDVKAGGTESIQFNLRAARLARLTRELHEQEKKIADFKSETAPSPSPDSSGSATPAAPATTLIEISAATAEERLLSKTTPEYPPDARAAGVSGTVVLRGTITVEGSVENPTVVSGPEPLRQSALDAVKHWKYKAYLLGTQPVPVTTTFNVTFTLPAPAPQT